MAETPQGVVLVVVVVTCLLYNSLTYMLLISAYKVLRFIICWLQNSVIGFNGDISWFFFSLWRLTASFSPSKYLRWHVIPHNKLLWKCILIFIISRSFHSQKQNNKNVLNRILPKG